MSTLNNGEDDDRLLCIESLIILFQKAAEKPFTVKLGERREKTISKVLLTYLQNHQYIPELLTNRVVTALDNYSSSIKEGLPDRAINVLYNVLRSSVPSAAVNRGINKHSHEKHGPSSDNSAGAVNAASTLSRLSMAKTALETLITDFCSNCRDRHYRIETGLLASAFFDRLEENRKLITRLERPLKELGQVLVWETKPLIRVVAGLLIRNLAHDDQSLKLIWTGQTKPAMAAAFESLLPPHPRSAWLERFVSLEETVSKLSIVFDSPTPFLVIALKIDEEVLPAQQGLDSTILISANDSIQCLYLSQGVFMHRNIDVKYESIHDCLMETASTNALSSNDRSYCIVLSLKDGSEPNCRVNHEPKKCSSIRATFQSPTFAIYFFKRVRSFLKGIAGDEGTSTFENAVHDDSRSSESTTQLRKDDFCSSETKSQDELNKTVGKPSEAVLDSSTSNLEEKAIFQEQNFPPEENKMASLLQQPQRLQGSKPIEQDRSSDMIEDKTDHRSNQAEPKLPHSIRGEDMLVKEDTYVAHTPMSKTVKSVWKTVCSGENNDIQSNGATEMPLTLSNPIHGPSVPPNNDFTKIDANEPRGRRAAAMKASQKISQLCQGQQQKQQQTSVSLLPHPTTSKGVVKCKQQKVPLNANWPEKLQSRQMNRKRTHVSSPAADAQAKQKKAKLIVKSAKTPSPTSIITDCARGISPSKQDKQSLIHTKLVKSPDIATPTNKTSTGLIPIAERMSTQADLSNGVVRQKTSNINDSIVISSEESSSDESELSSSDNLRAEEQPLPFLESSRIASAESTLTDLEMPLSLVSPNYSTRKIQMRRGIGKIMAINAKMQSKERRQTKQLEPFTTSKLFRKTGKTPHLEKPISRLRASRVMKNDSDRKARNHAASRSIKALPLFDIATPHRVNAKFRQQLQLSDHRGKAIVNEHGSPIPSKSSLTARHNRYHANKDNIVVKGIKTMVPDFDINSPIQSPKSAVALALTSSSNSKAIPSSPHAPSRMLQDMEYHHEKPNGEFENVQTARVIKKAALDDPFFIEGGKAQESLGFRSLHRMVMDVKAGIEEGPKRNSEDRSFSRNRRELKDVAGKRSTPSMKKQSPVPSFLEQLKAASYDTDSDDDLSEKQGSSIEDSINAGDTSVTREDQSAVISWVHACVNSKVETLISAERGLNDITEGYRTCGYKLIDALAQSQKERYANNRQMLSSLVDKLAFDAGQSLDDVERNMERAGELSKDIAKQIKESLAADQDLLTHIRRLGEDLAS